MLDKRGPGAGNAGAVGNVHAEADNPDHTRPRRKRQAAVAVIRDRDRTERIILTGRQLWALQQLLAAGPEGCTPLHNPAPRWSSYIARLRGKGVPIDTVREAHGGAYPGRHGRYVLAGDVSLEPLAEPEGRP